MTSSCSEEDLTIFHIVRCVFDNDLTTPIHGPLARYAKLRDAHAPGMPGTFSPPLRISDPDMHHGTCVTHVPWCIPGSLTSGFLWSRWRRKRSRHSMRMRNPQFYLSGKRPMHRQEHHWFDNLVKYIVSDNTWPCWFVFSWLRDIISHQFDVCGQIVRDYSNCNIANTLIPKCILTCICTCE